MLSYLFPTQTKQDRPLCAVSSNANNAHFSLRDADKGPAVEASEAGHVPDIGNIVNAKLTCGGGEDNVDGEKRHSPCSDGRSCVEADLGVYCECYVPESTGEEVRR